MQDRWTTPNTTKDGNRHRVGQRCGAVLALLLAGLLATVGQAAYLEDVPQTLVQPDGTVVSCFASGDEFYHWLHDADGYVIVKDPATGYFAYATKVGDELVASDCLAGSCDPRTLGVEPRLRPGRRILEQRRAAMAQGELALLPHPEGAPTFTSLANIVIFVRFSDQAEFTNPLSTYNSFFNASSGVSLFNYFKEASYNQTTITSTFYPTSGGTAVVSYQSPNPRAYYQKYDATTNPQGYNGDDERTAREHELVKAAVEAIAAQVPTSLNLDTNGDGNVDNVVLIVRGGVEGWSDLLWPHRWSLYTRTAYINGKRVYAYNFQLDDVLSVSVLCHEMGHTLGAPDLYHYDDCSSAPDLDPVWRWDLMANNRNPPQHSGAYVKQKWFGWISTIPEITTSGTYTLNPITSSTNNAYRIASPNSTDEYFVLEYRRATGTFETSLPGSGLLVYRVYPNANPSAPGNRCGPPDEVYVYRPNGTTTANGDPASAPFSADSGRTAINDSTNPSSFLSNGSPGGLNISNVTSVGNTISFTVTLGGGGCTYSISPTSASVPATGGSGTVTVTAGSGCTWTATSNAGWITVTSGASGSGNGSVGYSVAGNSGAARTGTLTIAGQTFTVNQGAGGGGGAYTYYVPAMAHNPGSSGTQWRSDLAVANTSSSTASLTLTYYSSSSPVVRSTTLAGNGTTKWGNVLESLFGVASGTSTQGTVVISANVPLAIVARTYNQAPSGTYGQFYPAVRSAHTIVSGQTAYLPGLEKSTAFRTNVGAINLGSSTCTVQFGVYTGSGVQVGSNVTSSVPAERWAQLNDLFGTAGAGNQSVAYAKVQPVSSGCQIWAYASVVDNATGDPTTVPMIVP